MTTDRGFAKDVARELDRRTRRRRLAFVVGAIAIVVLAVLYLRCGSGWGLGGHGGAGTGTGGGTATTTTADAGPRRCAIRVDARGVTIEQRVVTRAQALEACRGGAEVIVTGDAREGDWTELRQAFAAAKIDVFLRGSR